MQRLMNIFWLGLKEIRSLLSDVLMVVLVIYAFTLSIYTEATGTSSDVHNASIAFADEDKSSLSQELYNVFYPPRFKYVKTISTAEINDAMNKGQYMFVVVIPPNFEKDLLSGRNPEVQVNIDATALTQAGIGAGYITNIIYDRVQSFFNRADLSTQVPVGLVVRRLFNPNGNSTWFKSIVAIINQITLLTVVLTGAAVIREREHGTLEHLLVMPITSFEIAMAKVWGNGFVILIATALSLLLIFHVILNIPFAGSVGLWFIGVLLYLFFATAMGLFLGTVSQSMAQFALLIIIMITILMLLSGGTTPVESQPKWLQSITIFLPTRHFVSLSQVIIYRGGGIGAVWRQFVMVGVIGLAFFVFSMSLFRKSISVTK